MALPAQAHCWHSPHIKAPHWWSHCWSALLSLCSAWFRVRAALRGHGNGTASRINEGLHAYIVQRLLCCAAARGGREVGHCIASEQIANDVCPLEVAYLHEGSALR
jgi:hypothetical protein